MLTLEGKEKNRELIMSQAALKLVSLESADRDSLRFERRDAHRRLLSGRVTSVQRSVEQDASTNRICSIQLLDISDTGLGGVVQQPVQKGASIAVFFPPHGTDFGWDRYGHVVRCDGCEHGYQIGIRFVTKSAA